jgi:acyl-CoA reductase-like NAD-dependent aldehyde dehydrogenase
LALGVLVERAGLPKGVLSIVPSSAASDIGKGFCENPIFRKLTFTGSTKVGRILLRQDFDDVTAMANDTIIGLASYFYARDLSLVTRVANALEYGTVAVNTGIVSTEVAPFGGVKPSGLGREGSNHGIEEYFEMKYICMSV